MKHEPIASAQLLDYLIKTEAIMFRNQFWKSFWVDFDRELMKQQSKKQKC